MLEVDGAPIAVMDSGVGGLPYLESARKYVPGSSFVYLADRAGFPYGTKSRDEVTAIVRDRVGRLVEACAPAAVIIACNTASQAALASVRDDHPGLPVIGTVPALKPAVERSATGVIGILATERTVRDPYLDDLEARFASGRRVVRRAAQDLVGFIERDFFHGGVARLEALLEPHIRVLVEAGADEIVLACTHFLHVAEDIGRVASRLAGGRPIEIVDSRDGVARRLRELLPPASDRAGAPAGTDLGASARADRFYLTGSRPWEPSYGRFAARYGLSAPDLLPMAGGER